VGVLPIVNESSAPAPGKVPACVNRGASTSARAARRRRRRSNAARGASSGWGLGRDLVGRMPKSKHSQSGRQNAQGRRGPPRSVPVTPLAPKARVGLWGRWHKCSRRGLSLQRKSHASGKLGLVSETANANSRAGTQSVRPLL
jgi:hypothetical protein